MVAALGFVLITVSGTATWLTASRLAAHTAPRGPARFVAAAVLAAALVVGSSLALAPLGLGTSRWALPMLAVAVAAGTLRVVPRADLALGAEARDRWQAAGRRRRAALGATAGLGTAWLVWLWRTPFMGYDAKLQNLLQINLWVDDGRPGGIHDVFRLAPVGSFPLTNDVALAWLAGQGRTFAVVSPWALAMLAVLAGSTVVALRDLAVPTGLATAAALAVVTLPHVLAQVSTPKTDLPALAWLAAAVALGLAGRRHPRLAAVALVAVGLSIGSKTTTAPLAGLVAIGIAWSRRRHLRADGPLLGLGVALAVAVGGVWYLRNLVRHGSPLWPFWTTPWGDPIAPIYQSGGSTFLEDPVTTVRGQVRDWAPLVAGGWVLLAGGLVGVVARDRRARAATGLALLAAALWTVAPVTGVDNEPLARDVLTSTTRYLAPVMALGAGALALAATPGTATRRSSGRRTSGRTSGPGLGGLARTTPRIALAGAVVANLVAGAWIGPPIPHLALGVVGACGGATVAALLPRRSTRQAGGVACLLGLVVAGAAFTWAADGWTVRHRSVLPLIGAPLDELLADPRFTGGSHPVHMTNVAISDLAGDELAHPVHLVPGGLGCDELEVLAQDGWVVLVRFQFLPEDVAPPDDPLARGCFADRVPDLAVDRVTVFAPSGTRPGDRDAAPP